MQIDPAQLPGLMDALEPEQLSAAVQRPLPRRVLGRGTLFLLIALRLYVLVAIPLVAYAFVRALLAAQP
jgi:hypothetical protein